MLAGGLRRGHGAEGAGDELRGQGVEHVGLLQLQCLQLGLDLLEGDAVQAVVVMADGDKRLPELSVGVKHTHTHTHTHTPL